MDKGKYINNEHTTIEALSASIVSLILNEGKVVIPEFGYLELKVFPDKRTVLFKATEKAALFLTSEGSIQSHIYDNISIPLKEGKVVTLPEVGIFRPMKNADGSYHVSYTISSAFRKLLNDDAKGNETEKPEIVPVTLTNADDKKIFSPVVESESVDKEPKRSVERGENVINEKEEEARKEAVEEVAAESKVVYKAAENNEKTRAKVVNPPLKREIRVDRKIPSYVRNPSKVGDLVVPQDERKENNVAKMRGIIAVAAVVLALILVGWHFLPTGKNSKYKDHLFVSGNTKARSTQSLGESTKSYKSIDLPSLAEQKYGNRIFWVYIYEANRDKLSSPVNIPAGIDLRIPNLWEDYKVDVMDSMEIRRAEWKSNEMLKRKIQL